jgi:DNA-binding NarL/FixJ family response regulator
VNVLIADDSSLVRRNVRRLLSTIDGVLALHESDSVRATISAIEAESPDTVILDLHFPDGSGFEVLNHVKKKTNPPQIIVLTTFAGPSERDRAFALGAAGFLDKSTEYEQLFDLLTVQ